jgi:hypothetical protein
MQHHDEQPGIPARPPARPHDLNGYPVSGPPGDIDVTGRAGELDLCSTVADTSGGDSAP